MIYSKYTGQPMGREERRKAMLSGGCSSGRSGVCPPSVWLQPPQLIRGTRREQAGPVHTGGLHATFRASAPILPAPPTHRDALGSE